ncbi:unnamed protein product [Boreogadus saida]
MAEESEISQSGDQPGVTVARPLELDQGAPLPGLGLALSPQPSSAFSQRSVTFDLSGSDSYVLHILLVFISEEEQEPSGNTSVPLGTRLSHWEPVCPTGNPSVPLGTSLSHWEPVCPTGNPSVPVGTRLASGTLCPSGTERVPLGTALSQWEPVSPSGTRSVPWEPVLSQWDPFCPSRTPVLSQWDPLCPSGTLSVPVGPSLSQSPYVVFSFIGSTKSHFSQSLIARASCFSTPRLPPAASWCVRRGRPRQSAGGGVYTAQLPGVIKQLFSIPASVFLRCPPLCS